MDYSDDRLQRYINKMLQLQNEQREKPLTEQELKEIAFEIGMSEEDWQASQESYKAHLKIGEGHLSYRNWEKAIQELEQANALNPNSLEATQGLANAYLAQWKEDKSPNNKTLAEKFANAALQIKPGDTKSMYVLSELSQVEKEDKEQKKTLKYISIAVAGVLLLILIILYTLDYNIASSKLELIAQKWAQVENVYQRRADLIPKLVRTAQAASNFEKETLEKLNKIGQNLGNLDTENPTESELNNFQQRQANISAALDDFLAASVRNPELGASQAFRELQVQIEGAENRISVERKRYNEAVSSYNTFIKSFPGNLLGMKERTYLKMEKGADKSPDVKFE